MSLVTLPAPSSAPFVFDIHPEQPGHQVPVDDLHGRVFGPGRFARTAYRVRGRTGHDRDLSFVAYLTGQLVGAIWQTRVVIGATPAVLLGPLAVHPEIAGKGCGVALLLKALETARAAGAPVVILVGDAPYYARVGFTPVPHQRIGWPGPVDPARVLAVEFASGTLANLTGPIRTARWGYGSPALAVPGEAQAAE
jgi:predicted N-acetyltransferase YhbS